MANKSEPIYLNLSADDPDLGTTEIESMCMSCMKNVSEIHLEHSNRHLYQIFAKLAHGLQYY